MPASVLASTTVTGLNFGGYEATLTAQLNAISCITATWASATSLSCNPSTSSSGAGLSAFLTVSAVAGTQMASFSFDAPGVSVHVPLNLGASGSVTVTVAGLNFGSIDLTGTSNVGSPTIHTTTWTSSSTVMAVKSPAESATAASGFVTVGAVSGTHGLTMTFDAPVLSAMLRSNIANSGRLSVTVTGLSFGYPDYTTSAPVGISSCATAAWTSSTTVACFFTLSGIGSAVYSTVTVAAVAGTMEAGMSFDAPVVSSFVAINSATSNSVSVTVSGLAFAVDDATATGQLDTVTCASLAWSSASSVSCSTLPHVSDIGFGTHLTVGAVVGTSSEIFSFDAPIGSDVRPYNLASTRGQNLLVTVSGLSFGDVSPTVSAQLLSDAFTATWTSSTTIGVFVDMAGTSSQFFQMQVTVAAVAGTVFPYVSFDGT
jgi:hypothetical protein